MPLPEMTRGEWTALHQAAMAGARVTKVSISDHLEDGVDVSVQFRGGLSGELNYAVCSSGEVYSRDGEWEYEPMPSSREDDFIARTRFTLAEALKLAPRAVESMRKLRGM